MTTSELNNSIIKNIKHSPRVHRAVNWNEEVDSFTLAFWDQNVSQMWTDTEFTPYKDRKSWNKLPQEIKDAYKKVLGGLTLLDTQQGTVGMPKIADFVNVLTRKAVLSFMAMMENIHAKSYSTIFTTLLSTQEIDEVFEWVEENPYLQYKAEQITYYYDNITDDKSAYLAMVASVYLESFLFYSGFFLPLYLAGQGKMIASGEIINKIIQDESIHGVYVGLLAQEIYNEKLTPQEREEVDYEANVLLDELMENEFLYTEQVYSPIGLDHEVKNFLYYNANKALMNLGKTPKYEEKKINAIVQNGLRTESGTHDFFSTKGKSYKKAKHRPMTDEDFVFPDIDAELI